MNFLKCKLKTELLLHKLHFTTTLQETFTVKTKKYPVNNFIPTLFSHPTILFYSMLNIYTYRGFLVQYTRKGNDV